MARSKNVFVTGATGILGSHLTEALVEAGHKLVVLIRDKVPNCYFFELALEKQVTVIDGNLLDRELIERVLYEYEIEAIFHLGAQTQVVTALDYPLSTFKSNIEGTWNVLEAVRRYGRCEAVIVASSDKAYGSHQKLPYIEATPLQGTSVYDVSKSCADLLSQAYGITYKLPIIVTRCGNIFGEGDYNRQRLIPGAIEAFKKKQIFKIRSTGRLIRDYIYVKDVVEAYLLLWQSLGKKKLGGMALNISTQKPLSVIDVVKQIGQTMKVKPKYKILGKAENEIEKQTLDATKIKKLLGWKAKYSFKEGLKRTIAWHLSR